MLSRHLKATHKKEWAQYEAAVAKREEERAKREVMSGAVLLRPQRRSQRGKRDNKRGEGYKQVGEKNEGKREEG